MFGKVKNNMVITKEASAPGALHFKSPSLSTSLNTPLFLFEELKSSQGQPHSFAISVEIMNMWSPPKCSFREALLVGAPFRAWHISFRFSTSGFALSVFKRDQNSLIFPIPWQHMFCV